MPPLHSPAIRAGNTCPVFGHAEVYCLASGAAHFAACRVVTTLSPVEALSSCGNALANPAPCADGVGASSPVVAEQSNGVPTMEVTQLGNPVHTDP